MSYTSSNAIFGFPKVGYSMVLLNGQPYLGGGIKGFIPPPLVDTDNSDEYAITRNEIVQVWNYNNTGLGTNPRAITPFRAAFNAGDVLSRQNYSCGRQNQCFQSRPGIRGLKFHIGSSKNQCDNSGIPSATCNTKYVYDGSDYIKFKRQLATNKVFNLYTNGGNNSSGAQSAIRRIKHSRL